MLTPEDTVKQLLAIASAYSAAHPKKSEINRARFSLATVRKIAGSLHITENYLQDLIMHLGANGWCAIRTGDHLAVVRNDVLTGWTRLGLSWIGITEDAE